MKCLRCGDCRISVHDHNPHVDGHLFYLFCYSCGWWMTKEDYNNIVNEALEEALEES